MKLHTSTVAYLLLPLHSLMSATRSLAFQQQGQYRQQQQQNKITTSSTSALFMDRRNFGRAVVGAAAAGASFLVPQPQQANAQVFMDPAMYGDQELRVGAVDSVRESVRRAILKNPKLAPSFYELALLDALSFDAATQEYGPDGSVMKVVLTSKASDEYTRNLQEAALSLIEAEKNLRKKNAISLPDAIAIAGAEAIESIGGPVLPTQLGRADTPRNGKVSDLPLDLFSGNRPDSDITKAFQKAGMTDREMTALLCGLFTIQVVEKTRSADDWKGSAKPKFRERGKMGRMSEFKPITDEDIAQAELEDDPDYEDPDAGWYISDSFGSRDDRFGARLGKEDINEKTFNKFVKELNDAIKSKKGDVSQFGSPIATVLADPNIPTTQTWLNKYASSNLNYIKDLGIAYNAVTQLGAVYTGGKYENLLKNKPRKSLNDDDLNLF